VESKIIRGKSLKQANLNSDLENAIAGSSIAPKLAITLLFISLCFFAAIFIGLASAAISLDFWLRMQERIESQLMGLVVLAWLISAIYQSLSKSLLTVIAGLGIALIVQIVLLVVGFGGSISFFFGTTVFTILLGWAMYGLVFCLIRLAVATIDVLFQKAYLLKAIGFVFIILAGVMGSLIAITFEAPELSLPIKMTAFFSGIGFNIALGIGAWIANRRRKVPWHHPDLFRTWALAFGSWGGTSFHNLDLSKVNFKNAKLANTDLRARRLYRTCFQGVTGLERARVDSRYLDLEIPKVQKLLTLGCSEEADFSDLNLRGAYLQNADLRRIDFTDTDLIGADLRGADLRYAILANAQVINVDFTDANLTGICIQNWNVNSQTCFTNIVCDYIYRKLDDKGERCDRFPADRNFQPREFESLYQEVGNVVDLVFQEGLNWRAFAFTLQKLQIEDDGLGLELKGIEKRGDFWVVKVTHNENIPTQQVEKRLYASYEYLQQQLASKEQIIHRLLGITEELSKRPFGNNFSITGSTITNLAGSGQIEYHEAAEQVRSLVANSSEPVQVTATVRTLLTQLQGQNVANTAGTQAELIKQVLLTEAEKDPVFKQLLLLQRQQFIDAIPSPAIATAIQEAIAQIS
jgi:uncharacterized protein YjbI with pentapeptide repeats